MSIFPVNKYSYMNNLFLTVGYTLIDITHTNEVSSTATKERNQQRNWETLVQVLGLRTQLMYLQPPTMITESIDNYKFGHKFDGVQKIWMFKFGVEVDGIFSDNKSQHGTLENDFINVPIILELEETAKIQIPTFSVDNDTRNIYFEPFKI